MTSLETYWDNLTPEQAFLARVFVDHCKAVGDNRVETVLPVVTALAFRIQDSYNDLLRKIEEEEEHRLLEEGMSQSQEDDDARVKREEERMDREFVIGEMLQMALNLDYGDEIGRRKMFQLIREYLRLESASPLNEIISPWYRRYDLPGRFTGVFTQPMP